MCNSRGQRGGRCLGFGRRRQGLQTFSSPGLLSVLSVLLALSVLTSPRGSAGLVPRTCFVSFPVLVAELVLLLLLSLLGLQVVLMLLLTLASRTAHLL